MTREMITAVNAVVIAAAIGRSAIGHAGLSTLRQGAGPCQPIPENLQSRRIKEPGRRHYNDGLVVRQRQAPDFIPGLFDLKAPL
ncbi:MAG: hypothetical protein QOK29_1029 [Rhodospirillaceae bacterium]|nr:hypothetical protein [Rhodospirillaceae bacterium]